MRGCSLTVNERQSPSSDSPILFLQESLEPLPRRIDILGPKEILCPLGCVAMNKAASWRERTHTIVGS